MCPNRVSVQNPPIQGTEKSFFGDEVAGGWKQALTPLSEEIKNEWSHTSTLPYVLMFVEGRLHITFEFTFTFDET